MKQLWQSARTGRATLADVPAPRPQPNQVLVRVAASVVSAGTERATVEFAQKNILEKARARPDLVRQVLDKVRRDGLLSALKTVESRLDQPLAPGYSCAGAVLDVGAGVSDVRAGDRVACAGAGYASHAEVVSVPRLLVAKLPEAPEVSLEHAAFTTLGAIALEGIRLAEVSVGANVAVIGLGLLGQLTVQLLKAAGCRVAGMDTRANRATLALELGADSTATSADAMRQHCGELSAGHGVDAVLITADTPENAPVELAGEICRDRGCVVAVGNVGTHIPRRPYYEKELTFRISRSYGPGRYDPAYEEHGQDYPIAHARWTENRNMEAFLDLLGRGSVRVAPLVSHRFPVAEAHKAYELISGDSAEPYLGVLITFPEQADLASRVELAPKRPALAVTPAVPAADRLAVGVLGAGNFALSTLLPALKKTSAVEMAGVCAARGLHARRAADKFGFRYCTTDDAALVSDPGVAAVFIATRHHLHAPQTVAALGAGKHVYCEKPLALNDEELQSVVRAAQRDASRILMVGYNRRFAPLARHLKSFLAEVHGPLAAVYRINAGVVPKEHWIHDPAQGGGRIIGEVCHFVDSLVFLTGALPVRVHATGIPGAGGDISENVQVSLEFANGSIGTILYTAGGDKSFSKERVEVFGGDAVAVLDDFRRLEVARHGRRRILRAFLRRDKGHRGACAAFVRAALERRPSPVPLEEIVAASQATFRILDSLRSGQPETL